MLVALLRSSDVRRPAGGGLWWLEIHQPGKERSKGSRAATLLGGRRQGAAVRRTTPAGWPDGDGDGRMGMRGRGRWIRSFSGQRLRAAWPTSYDCIAGSLGSRWAGALPRWAWVELGLNIIW